MRDWQDRARKSLDAENQATVSDRQTSDKERGSGRGLPHGLPATLPNLVGDGLPTMPLDPTLEAPERGTKRPHDDDEITELPDEGEPAGPPKKKKKKKNSKDTSKDNVPPPEGQGDGPRPSTSMAKPEDSAEEPTPVPALSRVPEKEDKTPKKKKKKHKKKEAGLEKFQLEQREAKAKHQPLQHEQDFRAVRNYRKTLPAEVLETINGADHSDFLLAKFQKENNYMSQKSRQKRKLMTVKRLLSRITKYAEEPTKCLKKVQYGKEQNMGLHDVINPAAMARVTVRETHIVDGIPTTIKSDHTYCPFCANTASNHRAVNNHVWMHFRLIMVCGWPGCYFMHMQSLRMIEHSSKVHGMARAKPCREKGRD